MSKEDGLIFLDQPLPRGTVQMMTVEDMYNLTPRLFPARRAGQPRAPCWMRGSRKVKSG